MDENEIALANAKQALASWRPRADMPWLTSQQLEQEVRDAERNLMVSRNASPSDLYYFDTGTKRPTLTDEQKAQGYSLIGKNDISNGIWGYAAEKIAPPRPKEPSPTGEWAYDYNSNTWQPFQKSRGLMGKIGDIAMSPIKYTVKGIKELSGQVVDDALGMDGFSRTLDRVADKDLAMQRGITDGVEKVSQGNVSEGLRTSDDGIRNFGRDPAVAAALAAAAAYFGQTWLAPYLTGGAAAVGAGAASGTLGAAGAGAITGAGTAAAMGDSNLTKPALTGALGGATGAIGRGIGGTTGAIAGGALGGAGGAAIQGGDRQDILKGGLTGGAQGFATSGVSNLGRQFGVDPYLAKTASGALSGAIKDGSQGAEYGAVRGLLTGVGGQYGGQFGNTAGGLLANQYIQNDKEKERRSRIMPRITNNNNKSGYNQTELQRAYAQYLAQKRG